MMNISTKKGDSGDTCTLGGERVPKYHIITEAVGTIDEANSLLGLARASAKKKRTGKIIVNIQKHLFMIGAELSVPNGKKKPKTAISDVYVRWIEGLIEGLEMRKPARPMKLSKFQQPSFLTVTTSSLIG